MKMKKGSSARNKDHRFGKELAYVKSTEEVPACKSDDEIAAWYQAHSTLLVHDQFESVPARISGTLRARVAARHRKTRRVSEGQPRTSFTR
jgi:hypothetical protein